MNETSTMPLATWAAGSGMEACWMDFDGARMRYMRAGTGPPVILLHGLMGYSFSWRYAMPALAPLACSYAPDMLGAGFSDRPGGIDHSMRATALRVLRFAENLGLTSFDLLGTSRGGAVAMCAAAICNSERTAKESRNRSKLRVRKLVLVAPVNPYSQHGRWLAPIAGGRVGTPLVRGILKRMPFLYPYIHARLYADRRNIRTGSLEGYKAPLAIPGLFEHALSIVRTWTEDLRELEALLPELAPIPTFLMWGSHDPAVYASSMAPLARHFKNVQTQVFERIGHLPYEECPEEFNEALVEFMRKD